MADTEFTAEMHKAKNKTFKSNQDIAIVIARRTAFIARFIVLRESKRSRAHRVIELFEWSRETTAEELAGRIRNAFVDNNDNLEPVDRDLKRALEHASRSIEHFVNEYVKRATLNFIDALKDYDDSNKLLFGDEEEQPKMNGWRLPNELKKSVNKRG